MSVDGYRRWFVATTGYVPHPWQERLGEDPNCCNRLVHVPTGMGKTQGVLGAWVYNRCVKADEGWPRRLVWCLPMRVLVEQTQSVAREMFEKLGTLWDGNESPAGKVGVHLLMGGSDAGDWHLYPEECAVLIGTQDMLLSRVLNRGYGGPRARWPMEFGLLNQDCLWVMDEVQLMDVGLATSAQLQAFRRQDREKDLRPCVTWWMSATLQSQWLLSVDTAEMVESLPRLAVELSERTGPLWTDVAKPVGLVPAGNDPKDVADLVVRQHLEAGSGVNGPTLVVVNTVSRACALFEALRDYSWESQPDLRLVHSRFRPYERVTWRDSFLNRSACGAGTNRIIVATQVVEAGVDVSATTLITDLAPWPSLVQRFGRAARYGGQAVVIVADTQPEDDKQAAPYAKIECDAARRALEHIIDSSGTAEAGVALRTLAEFEATLTPAQREQLYPYDPPYLLLREEVDELFDTTPDLTGADLDISRFIRSGEERDVLVCWYPVAKDAAPGPDVQPAREALCPVPFLRARDWLCERGVPKLKEGCRAFVWDYLDGAWRWLQASDCIPGRIILVDAEFGGYDVLRGFTGKPRGKTECAVPHIAPPPTMPDQAADQVDQTETLSAHVAGRYQTILDHGRAVAETVKAVVMPMSWRQPQPSVAAALERAGRFHDWGKAHPAFQLSIVDPDRPTSTDLAKAPKQAWVAPPALYDLGKDGGQRRGFRHEVATALALLEALAIARPDHAALVGASLALVHARDVPIGDPADAGAVGEELSQLSRDEFDLSLYLACAHHGKVRVTLDACPCDQDFALADSLGMPVRGICDDDELPSIALPASGGGTIQSPSLRLSLEPAMFGFSDRYGPSWRERTAGLLKLFGPFVLGYLEALLRAADIRASRISQMPANGLGGIGHDRSEYP